MIYKNCKLYTDMSHFGAIVPRPNPRAFRPKEKTVFAVLEDGAVLPAEVLDQETGEIMQEGYAGADIVRLTTRHDEFSRVFDETRGEKTSEARKKMISDLEPFFEDPNEAVLFVDNKLANKKRAQIARSVRFRRKACLNRFDFFATFTYDDSKCTYEEFDRQLRIYFMNKACRDGWKVMYVPEYGKETGRYHIHAVIKMPSGDSIPGTFKRERRYSKKKHCMVTVIENTYFRDRWGQNDWQSLSEMSLDERRKTVGYRKLDRQSWSNTL